MAAWEEREREQMRVLTTIKLLNFLIFLTFWYFLLFDIFSSSKVKTSRVCSPVKWKITWNYRKCSRIVVVSFGSEWVCVPYTSFTAWFSRDSLKFIEKSLFFLENVINFVEFVIETMDSFKFPHKAKKKWLKIAKTWPKLIFSGQK